MLYKEYYKEERRKKDIYPSHKYTHDFSEMSLLGNTDSLGWEIGERKPGGFGPNLCNHDYRLNSDGFP